MQAQRRYLNELPLENESGFSRRIFIDSCKLHNGMIQLRGELVDSRADYQVVNTEIDVHGMVVRMSFDPNTREILSSEMSLPQMAFQGICAEQMPAKAEELVGVKTGKPYNQKVAEIFGATRGCMHLMTLYRAIGVAMNQINSWNHTFKGLDADCPPENVRNVMPLIQAGVVDSCHAWAAEAGGVTLDFEEERFGPMLERCTPKLLGRWKQYQENQEYKQGDE